MRLRTSLAMAAAIFAALGCNGTVAAQGTKPQQVTIFTGPQGGSWYAMGAGLAKLFTDAGVRANSELGAGVSNMVVISQGRGELGFTMSIIPALAEAGTEPFKQKISNVRGIANLGPNKVHIAVAADSGVNSVKDLKGKKFATQAVGAVTTEAFKDVLAANDMSEKDLDLTRGGQEYGANQMKDRRIVGFTATTLPPSPAFSEVSQSLDVKFLPLDDATFEGMKKRNPGYVRSVIPAGTYRGQSADVPTAAADQIMIVRAEMPEGEAYWIAKTLVENVEQLRKIHGSLAGLKVEDMVKTPGLELHPGAAKYYKEKGLI